MPAYTAAFHRLSAIRNAQVFRDTPLSAYTRFGIGGRAAVLFDTADSEAFEAGLEVIRYFALPRFVIGGGTNLIVSDAGFDGVVLRYTGNRITREGDNLHIEGGAVLQDAVDSSIASGLKGFETMTGIPGYVGGAVYGNAGAYGRSIDEIVERVHIVNGKGTAALSNSECHFSYRESIFKTRKDWVILSVDVRMEHGDSEEMARTAREIRAIRDVKYPPAMKCAGSIFKNLFFSQLPPHVQAEVPPRIVREGKVPSAWFLEQTNAKGLRRGDIQVASYHANLIYNDGQGTASDLVAVIEELKRRVRDRFGFDLEEEVQYVGFEYPAHNR